GRKRDIHHHLCESRLTILIYLHYVCSYLSAASKGGMNKVKRLYLKSNTGVRKSKPILVEKGYSRYLYEEQ
ncbi:hypothetical protein PIB30_065881, partial [Stylosanthes scabra]|nr:hypothetical protein [Stylosanthes scabra]